MADEKSDIQLDLDALAPPKVRMNYKGAVIEIEPPDLTQYAKIIDFSEKLQDLKGGKDGFAAIAEVYDQGIIPLLKEIIPELKDDKLNMAQASALFKLMAEIGAPTDKAVAKLKEQGIELKPEQGSPKDLASSEPSPNSPDTTPDTAAEAS